VKKTFVLLLLLLPALASAATPVSQCGSLAASGEYVLSGNVNAAPGADCFVVAGDGVSLDCAGFRVVGSNGGTGFKNAGFAGVALRGCTIQNFSVGVSFEGATEFSGGSITSNAVSGTVALKVASARSVSVSQNSFSGPVELADSSSLVFSTNTLNAAGTGVLHLNGVADSLFSDNAVSSGGEYALWAQASRNNVFNGGSFAGLATDALLDSSPANSFVETSFFHRTAAFSGAGDGNSFKNCLVDPRRFAWLSGDARVVVKNSALARVLQANGSAAEGASVNASASAGGPSFFSGSTNAEGVSQWFDVTVFDGNAAAHSAQSPYSLYASRGSAFSSVSGITSSPSQETTLTLGAAASPALTPTPSASPSASPSAAPNASVSPVASPSAAAASAFPSLGGRREQESAQAASLGVEASVSPSSGASLSAAFEGDGNAAEAFAAELAERAKPSPCPTPACAWCGVANALPWWVWVACALIVVAVVWWWDKQRQPYWMR
jgi:hypothetical protein